MHMGPHPTEERTLQRVRTNTSIRSRMMYACTPNVHGCLWRCTRKYSCTPPAPHPQRLTQLWSPLHRRNASRHSMCDWQCHCHFKWDANVDVVSVRPPKNPLTELRCRSGASELERTNVSFPMRKQNAFAM